MHAFLYRAVILSLAFLTPWPLLAGSPDPDGFVAGIYKDSRGKATSYRLYLPSTPDQSAPYPLVLYLHGFEGLGKDNKRQISGLSYLGSHVWTTPFNQAANPCFVLAPQCPFGGYWANILTRKPSGHLRRAVALIGDLSGQYPIDPDRVYVTGQSLGGFGAWAAISYFPEVFAAAIPVCGGGSTGRAKLLADKPVWAFHGSRDLIVWPRETRRMISALRKAGGDPRFTEFDGVGHTACLLAYAHPGLATWLFQQNRGSRSAPAGRDASNIPGP